MQVFGFDLVQYPIPVDHLKVDGVLPYPLPNSHFEPKAAVRNYNEHLEAWSLMEKLGFDGIGLNEHHCSPYGMMNSPNLMAAAASQHTERMKILIYGNCLPLHDPLRLAEEIAMLDCLSNGRIVSGFVRGIPREYTVFNVPMSDSRARFDEAWDIVKLAWTEEVFSYEGQFWTYKDIAIWPRPVQQPHPPVWVPVTMSKETIEWAGRNNVAITPGEGAPTGVMQDIRRYYAQCLEKNGFKITPDHLKCGGNVYVADSREQAAEEAGPYSLYQLHTLQGHGSIRDVGAATKKGWVSEKAYDYIRPENLEAFHKSRTGGKTTTLEDLKNNPRMAWGRPDDIAKLLIERAEEMGANTITLNFNQGAMPHELFIRNLKRFGEEVLPQLQRHEVTTVPLN